MRAAGVARAVFAVVLSLPAAARGQLLGGVEHQVNAFTQYDQIWPDVAAAAGGNFVIAWIDRGQSVYYDIVARRVTATGVPAGAEFLVNTSRPDNNSKVRIAGDGAGKVGIAWPRFDFVDEDIVVRFFDAMDTPLGPELPVSDYVGGDPFHASIAAAAGGFVVVWQSYAQDGSSTGVFGRRYDAAGVVQGLEFQVNTYTTGSQYFPEVAGDAAGNFLVVWRGTGASNLGVYAQRYDNTGTAQGGEVLVDTVSGFGTPAVAATPGGFVVGWSSPGGVFFRLYDTAGTPLGPTISAPVDTGVQDIAVDATGTMLFVGGSFSSGVNGRAFDSTGTALDPGFVVPTYKHGHQAYPHVAAAGDHFLVTWYSTPEDSGRGQDGSLSGVFARHFAPSVGITAQSVLIRDNPDGTRRKITFRSRDPILSVTAGTGVNPAVNGAFLHVYGNGGSSDSACLPLPASNWAVTGALAYEYRDVDFVHGPCWLVRLAEGKFLRANCKATAQPIPYTLDEVAQGSVGADFVSGPNRYCGVFGGDVVRDEQGNQFRARNAPAPAACPVPQASCP
jgi:hypothetical protein